MCVLIKCEEFTFEGDSMIDVYTLQIETLRVYKSVYKPLHAQTLQIYKWAVLFRYMMYMYACIYGLDPKT